jgi:nitrite reductase (NO-forming)
MNSSKKVTIVRIIFGFAWLVDAYFKWQPNFQHNVAAIIGQALDGQPTIIHVWIQLWVNAATMYPTLFGIGIASIETLIALSLITGIFARQAIVLGGIFALLIWSIPQGFGGPYTSESTDIDSGIIYALVFALLYLSQSWKSLSLVKSR